MSHFTVMVIGDVDENLAPFHEFECTGMDDEFVQNISKRDEYMLDYAKNETKLIVCKETGEAVDYWDDRFYREPTPEEIAAQGPLGFGGSGFGNGISYTSKDWSDGRGYRAKIHFIPEGWEEQKAATHTLKSFREFLEEWDNVEFLDAGEVPDLEKKHKYGYGILDEKGEVVDVIRRTNPNKKWDWYAVGGRWRGMLLLKDGTKADTALKRDIDFEGMRDEAARDAGLEWDQMFIARGPNQFWVSWSNTRAAFEGKPEVEQDGKKLGWTDQARKAYHSQPAVEGMSKVKRGFFDSLDDFAVSREAYVAAARDKACATFAYCENRQWAEKGEMGWWGISINEMEQSKWNAWLHERINALPEDALISIVDCHI